MYRSMSLGYGVSVAALLAVGNAFQMRTREEGAREEGSPLPLHLLDLSDKGKHKPGVFNYDFCETDVFSNLGGLGPDKGPAELRFKKVGTCSTGLVDLVVVNTSAYYVNDVYRNTARGCFGVINVAKESSVDLTFSFVKADTNDPAWAGDESYYFSMFDLDCSATGCEKLTMQTESGNFFVDSDNSELIFQSVGDGGVSFTASTFGVGSDNPPPLEALQKARSVTFEFTKPSMAMNYLVQNSRIGRNFLIGGKTMLVPKKATTTTTTLPGKEVCHECIVWGDPHVITFDVSAKRLAQHPLRAAFFRTRGWKNDELSIYDEGTFWFVKSERVHIQARYWHNKTHPDWTNLGALAIGGPFLRENSLIIRPLTAPTTWNGQEILSSFPSHFNNKIVKAKYHYTELVSNGKPGKGIDIELPDSVRLTVNRWKNSLAVMIKMCPQAGGQQGQCGNYNGHSGDDIPEIMSSSSSQRVPQQDFIF